MHRKLVFLGAAVLCVAVASVASAQQPAGGAQTPAQVFAANCASCHGATGTPNAAMARSMGIPDFATIAASPDSVFVRAITSGKGRMPAYGTRLQPAQVRALVAYVKSLRQH
jgi:mono/diheme cytochrome c family protein